MVSCHDVLRELSDFIGGEVNPHLRQEIEEHLKGCHRCTVLVDSTRKVLYVVGDERVFAVPVGYSDRLHRLIEERLGRT